MTDYGFQKHCKNGKAKLVEKWYLNPNININDGIGAPLRFAISSGSVETVKIILKHPNLKWLKDRSIGAMSKAIRSNDPEIVKAVFEHPNANKLNIYALKALLSLRDNKEANEIKDYMLTPEAFEFIFSSGDSDLIELIPTEVRDIFFLGT